MIDNIRVPHLKFIINNSMYINNGYFSTFYNKKSHLFLNYQQNMDHSQILFGLNYKKHAAIINLSNYTISIPEKGMRTFKKILKNNVFERWFRYIKSRTLKTYYIKQLPNKIKRYINSFKEICFKKYKNDISYGSSLSVSLRNKPYSIDVDFNSIAGSCSFTNFFIVFNKNKFTRFEGDEPNVFLIIDNKKIKLRGNTFHTNFLENILKKEILCQVYKDEVKK